MFETLALSELESYWTGGTIHIIVNNQIGFTTEPREYRFTQYPSDGAKLIQAPIFHVNADDPEACVHAAKLAIAFRQQFREDVIIDLVCYRRHGHNEADDPTYTQPLMYKKIAAHERVARIYTDRLLAENVLDQAALAKLEEEQKRRLEQALEDSTQVTRLAGAEGYHGLWAGLADPAAQRRRNRGRARVARDRARARCSSCRRASTIHPKLRRMFEQRVQSVTQDGDLDWGTAEALALGTLLAEGITVRLTGQDSERGTFGHRHAVLHDVETGERYTPLAKLAPEGTRFIIANSLLSEAAVLGFEYGYSTVDPNRLAIWEAQFGDFSNSAQVIIDQFIASGEKKWSRASGLVMLLPHGYEGKGPEHSSARLERFLQLCAEDNLQVCNLSTPAQYFHALRRQIHRSFRKPLIVMSPKSLLRHPKCVSKLDELVSGEFHDGDRRSGVRAGRARPERRRAACCSAAARSTTRCSKRARTRASRTSRSCASSSCTRSRSTQMRDDARALRRARGGLGAGRALEHGRLVVRLRPHHARAARGPEPALRRAGPSPRARRPARTACTRKSRPSSCARRSRKPMPHGRARSARSERTPGDRACRTLRAAPTTTPTAT